MPKKANNYITISYKVHLISVSVSRAVTPESVSSIPTMIQDLHSQTLRNNVPT